jgi:hypothetical protein
MSLIGFKFRQELQKLLQEELTVATDSNLLAHFRFNGNLTDSSGNSVSFVSASGTQSFVEGIAREALRLSDTATYSVSAIGSASIHSVEFWLKVDTAPTALAEIGRFSRGGADLVYSVDTNSEVSLTYGASAFTFSIKPTASFMHIVVVMAPSQIVHYENGLPVATASEAAASGTITARLTSGDASVSFDDLRLWDKSLSSHITPPFGQVQWHYRGMKVYETTPRHLEVIPPAVILDLENDAPNDYLLGLDYFANLTFKLGLLFEEGGHTRVVNGETLSDETLALWYAEELRRILWNTDFTSSGFNEDSRDARIDNHQEAYENYYLYGCVGRFSINYKGE